MNHKNKRQKDKMKHIQPFEQFMNEKSGGTGQLANAKYYWKIFNKKQKIDFLVGAGYSKSVANDLSNEDWDSLEIEVHKNLASVLENFVNEAESLDKLENDLAANKLGVPVNEAVSPDELVTEAKDFNQSLKDVKNPKELGMLVTNMWNSGEEKLFMRLYLNVVDSKLEKALFDAVKDALKRYSDGLV